MELVNIEELMKAKLGECDVWLNGKDVAYEKREQAKLAYEQAEKDCAEYEDADYVARVVAYRDDLKIKLGIKDEAPIEEEHEVVEPVENQPVEETLA